MESKCKNKLPSGSFVFASKVFFNAIFCLNNFVIFFPLDLNFVKEIFNSPEVSSTLSFSNACSQVVILFKEAVEPSEGRAEPGHIDRKRHAFRLGNLG